MLARFCMLRQQAEKESDDPYLSQADFIAPKVGGGLCFALVSSLLEVFHCMYIYVSMSCIVCSSCRICVCVIPALYFLLARISPPCYWFAFGSNFFPPMYVQLGWRVFTARGARLDIFVAGSLFRT